MFTKKQPKAPLDHAQRQYESDRQYQTQLQADRGAATDLVLDDPVAANKQLDSIDAQMAEVGRRIARYQEAMARKAEAETKEAVAAAKEAGKAVVAQAAANSEAHVDEASAFGTNAEGFLQAACEFAAPCQERGAVFHDALHTQYSGTDHGSLERRVGLSQTYAADGAGRSATTSAAVGYFVYRLIEALGPLAGIDDFVQLNTRSILDRKATFEDAARYELKRVKTALKVN